MKISVCIPCIEEHIIYLRGCLSSIYTQSQTPDEIVLVISNICDAARVNAYIEDLLLEFPNIATTVKYILDKQFAGENRNHAISIASGDIISFIDADDIMHKDRLNIIKGMFYNLKCVGVLHHFRENVPPDTADCTFSHDDIEPYMFSHLLHFGHGSFKKDIFDEFKYSDKHRGQDVEFVHNILPKYLSQLYIYKKPLTYYMSNRSAFYKNFSEQA
jgi:glycosyltransferase involved in cell wall biosynthesis